MSALERITEILTRHVPIATNGSLSNQLLKCAATNCEFSTPFRGEDAGEQFRRHVAEYVLTYVEIESDEPAPVDHFAEAERLLERADNDTTELGRAKLFALFEAHLVLDEIARKRGIGVPTIKPDDVPIKFSDIPATKDYVSPELPERIGAVVISDGDAYTYTGLPASNPGRFFPWYRTRTQSWVSSADLRDHGFRVLSAGVVL